MKNKSIIVPLLLILTSISLTFFMLQRNESVLLNFVVLTIFVGAVIYLLLTSDNSPLLAVLIVANHIMFFPGVLISVVILVAMVAIVSVLLSFVQKPYSYRAFLISSIPVTVYFVMLVASKLNPIQSYWYLLYFEAASFFIFTQFLSWNIKKIQKVVLVHLILIAIFGFFEFFITDNPRVRGPMQSSTAFGVMLVILWSLWVSIELFSKEPRIPMIVGITLPVFLIMTWTGTRMCFVGIILTCFLLLILKVYLSPISFSGKIWTTVSSSLVLLASLFLIWTILPDNLIIKAGFRSILRGEIDPSNMGRVLVWWIALKAFSSYPLFGIGNGNFLEFMKDYYEQMNLPESVTELYLLPHAHNVSLIILSENGIVGFLVALIVFVLCIVSIIAKIKDSKDNRIYGLLVGLCVMMALGMVDAVPYFPSTQLWGVWFLAVIIQLKPDMPIQNVPQSLSENIQTGVNNC